MAGFYGPTSFAFVFDMGFNNSNASAATQVNAVPVTLRVPDRVGGILYRLRAAPDLSFNPSILLPYLNFSVQLTLQDKNRSFSSSIQWNPVLNMSPITGATGGGVNMLPYRKSMYMDACLPINWAITGGGYLTMQATYIMQTGFLTDATNTKLIISGESILGPSL